MPGELLLTPRARSRRALERGVATGLIVRWGIHYTVTEEGAEWVRVVPLRTRISADAADLAVRSDLTKGHRGARRAREAVAGPMGFSPTFAA